MDTEVISKVIKPLVLSGVYKNEEVALKDIVAKQIKDIINSYQKTVDDIENKYGLKFDDFSRQIKGKSSIEEEEDWMDLKSSIEMKSAWEEALKEMLKNE